MKRFKMVTIFCEAVLEPLILERFEQLGVTGYTITECRGRGTHGLRTGNWSYAQNLRIEAMVDEATSVAINEALKPFDDDYGLLVVRSDVEVMN